MVRPSATLIHAIFGYRERKIEMRLAARTTRLLTAALPASSPRSKSCDSLSAFRLPFGCAPIFPQPPDKIVGINGVNVRDYTLKALRDKIGYVPQQAFLFKGTIAGNVAYGDTELRERDVKDACDVAQATEFIDKKEHGYESDISQGGANVSGGQKQRLSIARAVYRHPEILIFDDSFSALDFKTDRAVRDALAKEAKDSTKLIVAQRIGTIMDADRIVVLDEGRVVGQGTHRELLETCDVYRQIAQSQLSEDELKGGR